MPRIAKPAKPAKPQAAAETQTRKVEKTAKLSTPYIKAPNGTIIDEALAALAGTTRETALATDQILALCPSVASVGSLRSTLRRQVELGRVCTDGRTDRRKLRYFWWDAATDAKPAPAQVAPIHHATLNDGHEKNLDTLRRIGAEDHSPEPTKLIEPDPLQAVADALDLDAPGTTRFALWDDGQLLVAAGDDMMVLDAGSTRRLADFLESCMGL